MTAVFQMMLTCSGCRLQAACHKDLGVSKKAVSFIHDTVNAILSTQLELSHYHINEALFKPLETLLCLELCDADVQDQVNRSFYRGRREGERGADGESTFPPIIFLNHCRSYL